MGPELIDIIKLSAISVAMYFMGVFMKKADREAEFKIISLIALVFILTIVGNHIVEFFNVVETMLTF